MKRTDAWFRRQLAHVQRAIAEADKRHTPEEIAAAEDALRATPAHHQAPLFGQTTRRGTAHQDEAHA